MNVYYMYVHSCVYVCTYVRMCARCVPNIPLSDSSAQTRNSAGFLTLHSCSFPSSGQAMDAESNK